MKNIAAYLPVLTALALASCESTEMDSAQEKSDNEQVESRGAGKDNWWDALPRPEWAQYELVAQPELWFEVYKIRDDVFAIYEPGQFEEVISFLIVGSERALLFDSGLGIGNIRSVIDSLTDKDIIVLNSHTHYDHIGGNHLFEEILGQDLAYTRSREAGSTHTDVAEFVGEGWIWKELPAEFDAESFRSEPFTINAFVNEGYEIDIGGRVLEVLITPGHAPDSLCLIDRRNRELFVGDTFYLAPLYTHIEGSDFESYRQSAARLASLADNVDAVMTAHNVPVVDNNYLLGLTAAFESISAGHGDYLLTDGNREYDFGDFSIIVGEDVLE